MTVLFQAQVPMIYLLFLLAVGACSSSDQNETADLNLTVDSPEQQDPANGLTTESVSDPESESEPTLPPIQPGSDLERLVSGMKRVISYTLVDLNQSISSGTMLSTQQENCLGSFEPGLGMPLLKFDCVSAPLIAPTSSTGARMSIASASFFNTQACSSSILDTSGNECQLQRAYIDISIEWVVPEPPQRPYPIAGVQLLFNHAESIVSVNSLNNAPNSPFSCEIDLQTTLPTSAMNDCDYSLALAADRLEQLAP